MGSRAGIVQDETACLNYIQWQDDFIKQKPYEIISQCPSDLQERNFTLKPGPAQTIHDIRGREGDFDLDRNGFRVQPHAFTTKVFDKETIERDYLPAVETLLKSAIDTSGEVRIFDWRLRSSAQRPQNASKTINLNDRMNYLGPSESVHIDQSPQGALKRARLSGVVDPEDLDLEKTRIRIVNVWRPLVNPIDDYPLAVCDGSTVSPQHLVRVDYVRKHYVGESWHPLYSPDYRWYYLNRQTKDEALLMKIYDSKEDVPARCEPVGPWAASMPIKRYPDI